MEQEVKIENLWGARCDGFVDKGQDFSKSIQETWIHKQVVVKTGDGEDDFIIDEKPFMVDKVDLDKKIQEEAKGTDLKSLIAMVLRTGDDSILNQKPGVFVDITKMPTDSIEAHNAILKGQVALDALPKALKDKKTLDEIAKMSKEEILSYFEDLKKDKKSDIKSDEVIKENAPDEEVKGE